MANSDIQKMLSESKIELTRIDGDMQEIFGKASRANRSRNAEEKTAWETLKKKSDELTQEISDMTEQVTRDRSAAKKAGDITDRFGSAKDDLDTDNGDDYKEYRSSTGKATAFTIYKKTPQKNTVADFIGRNYNVGETAKFSPGELISVYLRGARNEVETRALSEGTNSAGGFTVPIYTSAMLIDNVRAKSTLFRAGAQTYILNSQQQSIAKITADATAAWLAESAAISATDPTFGSVAFSAKALKATVKASIEVIQDSLNIGQAIDQTLTGAFAAELDNAGLFGAGSATVPKGILNYTSPSLFAMGTNGAAITAWDTLSDLIKAMNDNNCPYPDTAITAPKVLQTLMKLKDTTNQPLRRPFIVENMNLWDSSKVPTNLTKGTSSGICSCLIAGGFQNLYYGSRLETTIYPTTEALATNAQYSFVAVTRGDWQPRREADFGVIKDIL